MFSRFDKDPSPEELAEIERRKAEVQARWTDEDRARKSTHAAPRPFSVPWISVSEMAAGAFGSRRRSRKDAS